MSQKVSLETDFYRLQTLDPRMNLDTYLSWLNDAEVIRYLTTPRLFKQSARQLGPTSNHTMIETVFVRYFLPRWCSHRKCGS